MVTDLLTSVAPLDTGSKTAADGAVLASLSTPSAIPTAATLSPASVPVVPVTPALRAAMVSAPSLLREEVGQGGVASGNGLVERERAHAGSGGLRGKVQ